MNNQQQALAIELRDKIEQACSKLASEIPEHVNIKCPINFTISGNYSAVTGKLIFDIRIRNAVYASRLPLVTIASDMYGHYTVIITGMTVEANLAASYAEMVAIAAKIADFMNRYEEEEHE